MYPRRRLLHGRPYPAYQPCPLVGRPDAPWTIDVAVEEIKGKVETFSQQVHLDLDDNRIRIEETESVDVFITIEEEREELTFRVPVRPAEDENRVALINYRTVAITISKPSSYQNGINQGLFRAYVSVPEDQPGGEIVNIVPEIAIPPQYQDIVRLEATDPETVRVTVRN